MYKKQIKEHKQSIKASKEAMKAIKKDIKKYKLLIKQVKTQRKLSHLSKVKNIKISGESAVSKVPVKWSWN